MDDERERMLRRKLALPRGIDAARDFLQTYVYDADLDQIEAGI